MFSVLLVINEYENPSYFEKALKSIYEEQTLKPSEIVLVKNGELTDDLENVLDFWINSNILSKNFELDFVKIIHIHTNEICEALAKGVLSTSYDLIACMDTNAVSIPKRFEMQFRFMEMNTDISVCGGCVEFLDKNNNLCDKLPLYSLEVLHYAKYNNPLHHSTIMFRKKDILDVGNYQPMTYFEDYYLWIRLLHNGFKIENLEYVLLHYHYNSREIKNIVHFSIKEFLFFKKLKDIAFIRNEEFIRLGFIKVPIKFLPTFLAKKLMVFFKNPKLNGKN